MENKEINPKEYDSLSDSLLWWLNYLLKFGGFCDIRHCRQRGEYVDSENCLWCEQHRHSLTIRVPPLDAKAISAEVQQRLYPLKEETNV